MRAPRQIERDRQAAQQRLTEDLRRMTRLHTLTAELLAPGELADRLQAVIDAAVDITGARRGNVQSDDAGTLTIVAQVGFESAFLEFFERVDTSVDSACAAAVAGRSRVLVEDVATSPIFAGRASLPVMTAAGVRAVQSTPLFSRSGEFLGVFSTHYDEVHPFDDEELRWLDLLARHAADVIAQHRAEQLLTAAHQELEARVADRTRWLSLMHEVATSINAASTWDEALHDVLRRLCATERWQIGFVYLPQPQDPDTIAPVVSCFADERLRAFHDQSMQQVFARGDHLPGRVYGGSRPFWAIDADALLDAIPRRAAAAVAAGLRAGVALPVTVRGEVMAVLELFSDRPHPPSDQLTRLMENVGDQIGRVLERERATARMADLVWREQQNLLHTLHDSVGQTLTGLGMLSTGLSRRQVPADAEVAATAAEIARQAQLALDQVRQLARNLFPVDVDPQSLMTALRELAQATESLHRVVVRVEGTPPDVLPDNKVAVELYRIAQEAVTNSVKHAKAKTITIRMDGGRGLTQLSVADDGVGIPNPVPGDGAGLHIMRHRATSIGASLGVEARAMGGTVVTCTLREAARAGGASA